MHPFVLLKVISKNSSYKSKIILNSAMAPEKSRDERGMKTALKMKKMMNKEILLAVPVQDKRLKEGWALNPGFRIQELKGLADKYQNKKKRQVLATRNIPYQGTGIPKKK